MDKAAIKNGGMLVIATSVPDEREWIQWRGRTARQDCPGQYHVVLNREAEPFRSHSGLADQLEGLAVPEQRLSRLLEVADENIGATLKKYERDQELGEMVNELTEAYFQRYPRGFDEAWPSQTHWVEDIKLRGLFEQLQKTKGATVKEVQKMAKEKLGIEEVGQEQGWQLSDLWRPKRQGEISSLVGSGD